MTRQRDSRTNPYAEEIAVSTCDVLVIGSGIAGIVAAIEAGQAGARVAIASKGALFSGSSFFPGTWGLGLVAPEDEADAAELAQTIGHVGCGVADPVLVEAFVNDLLPAIRWLESLGVELQRPSSSDAASQQAFIPCFDHKHRTWRGITREPAIEALGAALRRLDVEVLAGYELLDLVDDVPALDARTPVSTWISRGDDMGRGTADDGDGTTARGADSAARGDRPRHRRIHGALLADEQGKALLRVDCGAVVIATGGTSGLFARRLTSGDVLGSAHAVALRHGCALTNIEFMQMMPGLVSPVSGVVFNEKTFRYVEPAHALAATDGAERALLELRSSHGPFTSRLASRAVDIAIDRAGEAGWQMSYRLPKTDVPEFVETFAAWLERERGVARDAPLSLAMYAHASNGGIRIDADGWTGVDGLFACGEVTGGMHGADRIGGLSSANGIVFGRRAGRSAAQAARASALRGRGAGGDGDGSCRGGIGGRTPMEAGLAQIAAQIAAEGALYPIPGAMSGIGPAFAQEALRRLRGIMQASAMINRSDAGLSDALAAIAALRDEVERESQRHAGASAGTSANPEAAARGRADAPGSPAAPVDVHAGAVAALARRERLSNQLLLATCMLQAMRSRPESRGAHHRVDADAADPALAVPSFSVLGADSSQTPPAGQATPSVPW